MLCQAVGAGAGCGAASMVQGHCAEGSSERLLCWMLQGLQGWLLEGPCPWLPLRLFGMFKEVRLLGLSSNSSTLRS